MSTREEGINARLGMLAPAEWRQNINVASKRAGISRSHFCEIKEAFEQHGPERLPPSLGVGPGCQMKRHRRSSRRSWR